MKIAVSGKGGVGKTTLSAFLAKWFARQGMSVLAIDADPDANLGHGLGFPMASKVIPISTMKELIAERTESIPGTFGGFFKLNPKVEDLPEMLAIPVEDRIRLMVMGGVKKGGTGCVCPESAFLKNLVQHLILRRNEVVVMDMEAGIEHLGRATSQAVDCLVVVVEPGRRSVDTASKIKDLAADIGLTRLGMVGNKIRGARDRDFLLEKLSCHGFLGFIPYDEGIIEADLRGNFAESVQPATKEGFEEVARNVLRMQQRTTTNP